MRTAYSWSGMLAICSLLAACGGGGGSESSSVAPPSPALPSAVAITPANAPTAASIATSTADTAIDLGTAGGDVVTGVVPVAAGKKLNLADIVRAASAVVEQLAANPALPAPLAAGVVPVKSVTCPGGGFISVSVNDLNADNVFSTGDTASATFSSCIIGGITFGGSLSIANFALTGTPGPAATWSMSGAFSYNNIVAAAPGASATVNGTLNLTYAAVSGTAITVDIANTSLALIEAGGDSISLSNYFAHSTLNTTTQAYTATSSGTVSSNNLGGSVTFTTTSMFQGFSPNHPFTGTMKIAGLNNTSVTLTALNSINVRLDVDNGTGALTTINTTWDAL